MSNSRSTAQGGGLEGGGRTILSILDLGDLVEVLRVGDAQTSHAVGVPPLLEVPLERSPALVGLVAADLALVHDPQAVQLVEPVGDGLAVPTDGVVLLAHHHLFLLLRLGLHIRSLFFLKLGLWCANEYAALISAQLVCVRVRVSCVWRCARERAVYQNFIDGPALLLLDVLLGGLELVLARECELADLALEQSDLTHTHTHTQHEEQWRKTP